MIRVTLPFHLCKLAGVADEITVDVEGDPTADSILTALESRYPMLRGTIRDHTTGRRRPFLRYFACRHDYSHEPTDTKLPDEIAQGIEPFMVVGAIAGG
jgi:hypothetical protein